MAQPVNTSLAQINGLSSVRPVQIKFSKSSKLTRYLLGSFGNDRNVYDQLYAYLEEHNIIFKYNLGFRTIHSNVTALLEATDTWAYNIDRGKINVAVFLELKMVFDTIGHLRHIW